MQEFFSTSYSSLSLNASHKSFSSLKFSNVYRVLGILNIMLMDAKRHTKTYKEIKCIMDRFRIPFKTHALLPFMILRMLGHFLGDFD